jgi:hypothetical protein
MNRNENDSEDSTQITEWKKEPSVEDLKKDLTMATKLYTEQVGRVEGWLDNLHVQGKAKIEAGDNRSSLVPRLIRKQAEWRYAALSEPFLGTNDIIEASPVTWEDAEGAKQTSLLLNHQFRTSLDRVAFIDEYVRTAVDEGTVIIRTGWNFLEEEATVDAPVYEMIPDPSMVEVFQDIALMEADNPTEFKNLDPGLLEAYQLSEQDQIPYRPIRVGTEEVQEMRTVANHPTASICAYDDVYIDPTCQGDIKKARFVIFRSTASKAELEAEGIYSNLDKLKLDTTNVLGAPDDKVDDLIDRNFDDDARKKFTVYEYWGFRDIDGTGLVKPIVSAWAGDTIIRMEENPYPDKELPVVVVQYLPVRKHLYGEPDGALLEDNQKVLGATIRGMIDIMARSANGQTGMRKGSLDTINRKRFREGDNYEFNSQGDPRNSIFMHTFPEIPSSAQFMMQMQNSEAESLTGVKAYNNGISGDSLGEVAAGVRGALDASSKRELGILRRLAEGIVKILRKWMAMNAEFLDEEEIVRVTNSTFETVRRDDIGGKYDLKLSISTAEEDAAKAQELAFMLQTVGPNTDFNVVKTLLIKIANLRKMPDVAKQIEEYEPQPDPLEQRIKELEVAKLQAEIEEIQSRTVENYSAAKLDSARSNKEMANAANIQSDTDRKDLDFVEQESGVHQARELERLGEQAKSNISLEREKFVLAQQAKSYENLQNYLTSQ